jgi:energy-coupling factor transporter transmembrane protein EcfT
MSGARTLHGAGVAGDPASPIHRLDPRAKLIGFAGITVVAVSAPLAAIVEEVNRMRATLAAPRLLVRVVAA